MCAISLEPNWSQIEVAGKENLGYQIVYQSHLYVINDIQTIFSVAFPKDCLGAFKLEASHGGVGNFQYPGSGVQTTGVW